MVQSDLLTSSEKDLQRQVKTAKDQLRDLHTSNESTQAKLMDASQRQGESNICHCKLTGRPGCHGQAGGAGARGGRPDACQRASSDG